MRISAIVALALLLVGTAQAAPKAERVTLPNGLTVIAIQDDSSAVAAFHLAVRVNPLSLPENHSGIMALSQQVAQVYLKGLYCQPPWVALGEEINSTPATFTVNTEMDYCEVRSQLPASSLPGALKLAALVQFSRQECTPEQVAAAKDILSNEIADSGESVVEATFYCFLKAYYGSQSPLAQPVEGAPDSLMSLAAADVNSFRATFIGPNNASLCVIGPQPTEQLLAFARDAFGGCDQAKTTQPKFVAPPLPADSRISVAALPKWRGVSLMVGVPVPAYGTRDFLRAQLLYTLLEGDQGRLQRDEELAGGFGLNQLMNRKEGESPLTVLAPMPMPQPFLIVHMMTIPRIMEDAREALLGHFLAFATRPPEPDELAAGKQRLANAFAMMETSKLNFAKSVNCDEVYGQDYRQAWEADKDINAITGDELMALAKQWFSVHAVGLVMPGDEAE